MLQHFQFLGSLAILLVSMLSIVAFLCKPRMLKRCIRQAQVLGRRPLCEVMAVILCVGGFVQYAATKRQMTAQRIMPVLPAHEGEVGDVDFSDFPGAVTETRVTGINIGADSVFLRAQWPMPLPEGATSVEVYARAKLEEGEWVGLGRVPIQTSTDDSLVVRLPYTALSWDWTRSSFFGLGLDSDWDRDGLSDAFERVVTNTNPRYEDSDYDGMPDGWEHTYGLNPNSDEGDNGADGDPDRDGLVNRSEYAWGTAPKVRDTDADGLSDGDEVGWYEFVESLPTMSVVSRTDLLVNGIAYDDELFDASLPFLVRFGGFRTSRVRISVNGFIWLLTDLGSASDSLDYINCNMSDEVRSGYHGFIAAYWDDLEALPESNSRIYVADTVAQGHRFGVVGYENVSVRASSGGTSNLASFRVLFPEDETNIVYVVYDSLGAAFDGAGATIGAQTPKGMSTFPVSCDTPGSAVNGMVIAYHFGTGSSPLERDTDGDGLMDCDEVNCYGGHPGLRDTDSDGLDDAQEVVHNTRSDKPDSDEDDLPDGWEVANGLDPLSDEGNDGASGDYDSDGLTNLQELHAGSHPRFRDFDGDGLDDPAEILLGTNPRLSDTDRDGLSDGVESALGMNPLQPDTDGDGMNDGWENRHMNLGFNPTVNNGIDDNLANDIDADPDHDGLTNGEECVWGTNPCNPDTDGDGVSDGEEVAWNSDPNDASDLGRAETRKRVRFYFGDDSGSHSEKYLLEITPVVGPEGELAPSTFRWLNERYGHGEWKEAHLKFGWKYRVKLSWASCSEERQDGVYPNYDYTLRYESEDGGGLLEDDPEGLFVVDFCGSEWYGEPRFPKLDNEAYLYVLGKPRLVFDYDRNGLIDTTDEMKADNEETIFRFWVNDDADSGDVNDSDHDKPGSGPNCANVHVDGRGDLLDFTPIWIDIRKVFPPDTPRDIQRRVRWRLESSCLNAVWTNLSRMNAGIYRTTSGLYEFGGGICDLAEVADVSSLAGGAWVPDALQDAMILEANKGVVLMEGCSVGDYLCIKGVDANNSRTTLVESAARLRVTNVEDMYRYVNLRGAVSGERAEIPASPSNEWDAMVCDRDVFFTHGFRVSATQAHAWGSEVFKRLWQSGSNARFTMLTWSGDYGFPDSGLYFQQNVYHALTSGAEFKRIVEAVQPVSSKRVLMAQSLGNMVACEALRQGLLVQTYFMFNAAVASECFDGARQGADIATQMKYVPTAWRSYDSLSWASNWHRLFVSNPEDSRSHLGWVDRYLSVLEHATSVCNYYSTGDETFFELPNPPWIWSGILGSPASYAWQKQETMKGLRCLAGTMYGGWGFHTWFNEDLDQEHYSAEAVIGMITTGSLSENPVFNRDYGPMLRSDATNDEVIYALAKYIPAISTAIGAVAIVSNTIENHDLNSGTDYHQGWGRSAENGTITWKHSDMKDVAYFYVWPLYDEIVNEKGALK